MKPFLMLLRRESWEHPAFWVVPSVVAGLMLLSMAVATVVMMGSGLVDPREVGVGLSHVFTELGDLGASERRALIGAGLAGLATPFAVFLVALIFFYALDSLFREYGAVELSVAFTALVIGSALLLLSAFWTNARRAVVRPLAVRYLGHDAEKQPTSRMAALSPTGRLTKPSAT